MQQDFSLEVDKMLRCAKKLLVLQWFMEMINLLHLKNAEYGLQPQVRNMVIKYSNFKKFFFLGS
jgi:hypothetical protein